MNCKTLIVAITFVQLVKFILYQDYNTMTGSPGNCLIKLVSCRILLSQSRTFRQPHKKKSGVQIKRSEEAKYYRHW